MVDKSMQVIKSFLQYPHLGDNCIENFHLRRYYGWFYGQKFCFSAMHQFPAIPTFGISILKYCFFFVFFFVLFFFVKQTLACHVPYYHVIVSWSQLIC